MKRQPQFVRESKPYQWIEWRYRRWIVFGERRHYWILRSPTHAGYSFEVGRFSHDRYVQLAMMQQAVPTKVGQTTVGDRAGDWHVGAIYWYRDGWYEIPEEFGPENLIPLINAYQADIEAAKSARQQKRSSSIEETKRRISRTI